MNSYHLLLTIAGFGTILAFWLPRFISGWEPAASALLVLTGFVAFSFISGMPDAFDPLAAPRLWETISEIAVTVALFGTGLKIDRVYTLRHWQPTIGLLIVTMPLTIGAIAYLGVTLGGMTLAGAVLLGAALAPTDPVLAGNVQVGPPLEGGEHPVRFSLTTEAGLNDGLAFPFVYLGLILAVKTFVPSDLLFVWLVDDVFYRIGVGVALGAGIGWMLGKVLFTFPRDNPIAATGAGLISLAGVLFCYGATELAEGYGFISVFIAGMVLRRAEVKHPYHRQLHDFSEAVEYAISAVILVLLGGALPVLLPYLTWTYASIGLALIFVIRPITAWLGLIGSELVGRDRLVVAFYGVRGVGSIYYLGFGASHVDFLDKNQLWATVAFTIVVSTVVHGLTAGMVMRRFPLEREDEEQEESEETAERSGRSEATVSERSVSDAAT
ncbi:cation:proton antiporter [Mangrovicella endophytica]|uniref:cation:proton antiporter n=1 Tax=Mangrovicella endophytica TaxID=2066697 RepID=UPI0018E4A3C2|nr:cation:proton antiporter [Mangrovicella endophytica]